MPSSSSLLVLAAAASLASAQTLFQKRFTYPNGVPYKVDNDPSGRGPQSGYNICNSTTEGPRSQCQTAFINNLSDFCLWGPPDPNSTVANEEAAAVAYCTKAGRGTRLIPDGALKGVQFVRTPGYLSVVGFIDQTGVGMASDDSGGELDPHGDDGRGNPLGGLVFSNAFNNGAWTQVTQWHNFMGGNVFCIKACTPGGQFDTLCNNIYDRIGCEYNVPANYAAINGTFESCLGENQLPPGVYYQNGQQVTYQQPPENGAPINQIPYTPQIPATSSCVATPSAALYTDAAAIVSASSASVASIASVSAASVSMVSAASAASASRAVVTVTAPTMTSVQAFTATPSGKNNSASSAAGRSFEVTGLVLGGAAATFISFVAGALLV